MASLRFGTYSAIVARGSRALRACLAACALVAAGGCLGDGGSVMLTVDQAMNVSPALTSYSASNATANVGVDNFVHFTATSPEGTLTMLLNGPLKAGDMVDLAAEHNFLSFDVKDGGWSSNGGMLAVDGVGPYRVRFLAVPMLKGSGTVTGSFVFNGSGTFK
jgi:hypothetical protein